MFLFSTPHACTTIWPPSMLSVPTMTYAAPADQACVQLLLNACTRASFCNLAYTTLLKASLRAQEAAGRSSMSTC